MLQSQEFVQRCQEHRLIRIQLRHKFERRLLANPALTIAVAQHQYTLGYDFPEKSRV